MIDFRKPRLTLVLTTLAVAVFWLPGLSELLQLETGSLGRGEVWRLVTCHWTHWHGDHLVWDALMFAILGLACERIDAAAFRRCLLLAVPIIPVGVLLLEPRLATYRGLSGIDAALFVLLARHLRLGGAGWHRWLGTIALVGFAAKIGYEIGTGNALFVAGEGAFTPSPMAHLLGALTGCFVKLGAPRSLRREPFEPGLHARFS